MLSFMAVTIFLIVRLHNLFAVVMLGGLYSLMAATIFVVLDAVDVAFTEAAVGAGISTVLMLGALALTNPREKEGGRHFVPLLVAVVTFAALLYGTWDMPRYGDPIAPIHTHVAPTYLRDAKAKTTVPNVVTAVLASYRGYDTLGEVVVIFTAGVGVMVLLGGRRRKRRRGDSA